MRRFAREGITSFFVPGFADAGMLSAFKRLRRSGGLTARAHIAIGPFSISDDTLAGLSRAGDRMRERFETRLPRSVRAWRPGRARGPAASPQARHLDRRREAVPRRRRAGTSRGDLYIDDPRPGRLLRGFERRGFQAQVHAIGDRAVRVALDGGEAMRDANGMTDSRPSLAHVELVTEPDLRRFRDLRALPVMSYQWAKPAPDSTDTVLPFLGPERSNLYEPEGSCGRPARGSRSAATTRSTGSTSSSRSRSPSCARPTGGRSSPSTRASSTPARSRAASSPT